MILKYIRLIKEKKEFYDDDYGNGAATPILCCDIMGFGPLQTACEKLVVMNKYSRDLYMQNQAGFTDDVTAAVVNLIKSGRQKFIPEVAHVFKSYGLSDLLTGMRELIREIVHGFAYARAETTEIVDFATFRAKQPAKNSG